VEKSQNLVGRQTLPKKLGRDTITVKVPLTPKLKKRGLKKGFTYKRKDVGAKGKGLKVIPPLKTGTLTKLLPKKYQEKGWFNAPERTRKKALVKGVKKYGYISLKGKLWALVQLFKRTNRRLSKKARKDFDWLVRNYGLREGFPLGR
jgi:hypothetical protein